ncbi:hypothetical protein D3C77_647680 [compost metagenome]
MQGAEPRRLRRVGQVGLAVKPHPAITAAYTYSEVSLMAQLALQGGQARGEAGWVVDAVEHLAQHG